jgi:RNA polymerase sigma-70 factor (ECF subfamily)
MAVDLDYTTGAEGRDLTALMPHMRAFAQSLCHNRTQAEDLAQNALTSAWAHRSDYAPGTNLKAWVFKILRNQYYADHRRAWRVAPLDPELAERTLIAVSNVTATLELDDVRRAMRELPDEQREALMLIGVSGLSYGATAAVCGCAEGTIKSRVNRARLQLHSILSHSSLLDRSRVTGGVMATMIADAELMQTGRRASRSAGLFELPEADAAHLYRRELAQ